MRTGGRVEAYDEQEQPMTPPAQYVFKPFVALYNTGQQIIKWLERNTIHLMVYPFRLNLKYVDVVAK